MGQVVNQNTKEEVTNELRPLPSRNRHAREKLECADAIVDNASASAPRLPTNVAESVR